MIQEGEYHFFEILFDCVNGAKKNRQKYFIVRHKRHKNIFPIKSIKKS